MTLTLELTPEQEARLNMRAAKAGLDAHSFVERLIDRETNEPILEPEGETVGQTLLREWEEEGVLGLFADRPDSPEFARMLRRQAEQRGN